MSAARDITATSSWTFRPRETRTLTVTIPLRTKNPLNGQTGNSRIAGIIRSRTRKQQRTAVELVMAGALRTDGFEMPPCSRQDASGRALDAGEPPRAVRVTLTRLAPSSGLDDDGLTAALKSVRDGVADALGVNDRDARIEWHYGQRRSKPRVWAVEISISKGHHAGG